MKGLIKKVIYTAYKGKKVGITYERNKGELSLMAVVESLTQFLALYAAHSELVYKFLGILSVPIPFMWGRIISSGLGTFICGYILLSVNTSRNNVYRFHKISRFIAGILIWVIFFSFATASYKLIISEKTYIDYAYSSSLYIAPTSWNISEVLKKDYPDSTIYTLDIQIPHESIGKFKHLRVFIEPIKGFKLVDIQPECLRKIDRDQEPLEIGRFKDLRSEWLFPLFDNSMQWKIFVKVTKSNKAVAFTKEAPLQATFYFND